MRSSGAIPARSSANRPADGEIGPAGTPPAGVDAGEEAGGAFEDASVFANGGVAAGREPSVGGDIERSLLLRSPKLRAGDRVAAGIMT
jgi:hypothetical protein